MATFVLRGAIKVDSTEIQHQITQFTGTDNAACDADALVVAVTHLTKDQVVKGRRSFSGSASGGCIDGNLTIIFISGDAV